MNSASASASLLLLMAIAVVLPSANPAPSSSSSSNVRGGDPRCISVDSYHTYVCTDSPEATRRALDGAGGGGVAGSSSSSGDDDAVSAFDIDLGVEQRITGSEAEQLRIRNVLRRMYAYFEDEVLSRSEFEHVRGSCKNDHELCAFWTSVGECESNRGFMLENCAAACRLCLLANTNMMA